MSETTLDKAYRMLTSDDDGRVCRDIPESACNDQPRNFITHIASLGATKTADGLIDPKLVLSWLLTQLGAPAVFIGLLVPVRESGALLPQLLTAASLRRLSKRKWAWSVGSAIQGLSAAAIALAAIFLDGAAAGIAIVSALGVLALARSVCSVTYKDVLGKTVSKARRGTATGTASSLAAFFVIIFGAILATGTLSRMPVVLAGLLVAAGLWLLAAVLFSTLQEEAGATEGGANPLSAAMENFGLLAKDAQLRRFIATRGLLISTALAPPFMVALGSNGDAENAFGGLGLLVIASAGASLLSSYVWGRLADRSSRKVLIFSAIAASVALAATLALNALGLLTSVWGLPAVIFALMLAYQGVRLGRSTHLVDMATQDTRAAYTALSNTIIGLLLAAGGAFSLLAEYAGVSVVIGVLAAMSALSVLAGLGLEEVQQKDG
ncbi:MAG TPA: MFS transporter [Henriciella marina]|uniref:MFS transporter n=1 Tax=Henriciella sp. TaxID=1968823 RepID=UPI00185B2556|nr:MFS transporter [Henriciella sp.]HIG21282.1 MFS transporter [Henriciella sp.]HIK64469.1 MFS transporter [Henriciella marina]